MYSLFGGPQPFVFLFEKSFEIPERNNFIDASPIGNLISTCTTFDKLKITTLFYDSVSS
jgi:hypothetical protein